jgi:hypothetical protein
MDASDTPQITPRSATHDDPRLAAVIEAWNRLPEATRAGIMAMIGAASNE